MNQRSLNLLAGSAAVAALAATLYALNWRRQSHTMLREIRAILNQHGNKLHKTYTALTEQRPILNDAHKHIAAVTKRSQKASS